MVLRRCPQCNTTSDDKFGFCVKCGYEFPKIDVNENTCPLCGSENPPEATYCVKCGTPLIFKNAGEQTFDHHQFLLNIVKTIQINLAQVNF